MRATPEIKTAAAAQSHRVGLGRSNLGSFKARSPMLSVACAELTKGGGMVPQRRLQAQGERDAVAVVVAGEAVRPTISPRRPRESASEVPLRLHFMRGRPIAMRSKGSHRRRRAAVERRREGRYAVQDARLNGGTVEARIVDLSHGGLAIETRHGLRVGGRYCFALAGGGPPTRIEVEVRWCRLAAIRRASGGDALPIYLAGLSVLTVERD